MTASRLTGSALFAPSYKDAPYWWEAAPPPPPVATDLPAKADLVIVGAGYTGLSAALETQRGGRETLLLDAESAGWGCSSRNGGQVAPSIKPDYASLTRHHGAERAYGIRREGLNARAFIEELIRREGIDCDWEVVGRFHAAHNPKQYEALARSLDKQVEGLAIPYEIVPRAQQRREIGSDFYHGGVIYPQHAALHPARYLAGLYQRVTAAGARVIGGTRVLAIERDGQGFQVKTSRGTVSARDVLVASNGYTGPGTPWLRRRVIPIGSYIIATEAIDPALARTLVPNARVLSDTRKLVFYYRLSPDRRSLLFGGRVAYNETDPRVSAPRLHQEMTRIFPELAETRITHSWAGFVAYTFDHLPHLGRHEGVWYCMGYCGSGVSLSTYFGARIGQQILGRKEGATALDGTAFQTRPLYYGTPWFLPTAIQWYRLRDRLPV